MTVTTVSLLKCLGNSGRRERSMSRLVSVSASPGGLPTESFWYDPRSHFSLSQGVAKITRAFSVITGHCSQDEGIAGRPNRATAWRAICPSRAEPAVFKFELRLYSHICRPPFGGRLTPIMG